MKTGNLTQANSNKVAYLGDANSLEGGVVSAELFQVLINSGSTGMISGGLITADPGNSTFSISSGIGVIAKIDSGTPDFYQVTWNALHNLSTPYMTTDTSTWIFVNENAEVEMYPYSTNLPFIFYRTKLLLGRVVHATRTIITSITSDCLPVFNPVAQLKDLLTALGPINISGNVVCPIGGLQLKKSEGVAFKSGSNYKNNFLSPHITTNAEQNPMSFRYRYRIGSNEFISTSFTTFVDPNHYDNGTGLVDVPTGHWTTQRFLHSPTNNVIVILSPQTTHEELDDILLNFQFETFEYDTIVSDGNLRGYMLVKQGATDLTDLNQAVFFQVDKNGLTPLMPVMIQDTDSNVSAQDSFYLHNQVTPLNTWVVNHSLGKYPSVSVVDSGNNAVQGEVIYLDQNSLEIHFAAPFGGKAYIN